MPDDLSPRERECARLAAQGLTNKEIAAHLGISPKTVSNILAQAYRKLGVGGRREVAPHIGHDDPGSPAPISVGSEIGRDRRASGDAPTSSTRPWPLPEPPPVGRRWMTILVFMVAGALLSLVAGVTIWTVTDVLTRRSPPNAIQALDDGSFETQVTR